MQGIEIGVSKKNRTAIAGTVLGVVALWALGGWFAYSFGAPSHGGEFGDMFGPPHSMRGQIG
jgi:hypothetical protein